VPDAGAGTPLSSLSLSLSLSLRIPGCGGWVGVVEGLPATSYSLTSSAYQLPSSRAYQLPPPRPTYELPATRPTTPTAHPSIYIYNVCMYWYVSVELGEDTSAL
jgi:hypothetical protein